MTVIHMPNGKDLRVETSTASPNFSDMVRAVEEGVEKKAVPRLAEGFGISKGAVLSLLEIDPSTFSRRERLNRYESERVLRLSGLLEEGREAFGDLETFRRWFQHTNVLLGNLSPLEACRFEFGVREVENLLARIRSADFIA